MLKVAYFCLAIAATSSVWCQVEPSATGGGFSLDDTQMMTPPPVTRGAYPVVVGGETRSNYLEGGLVFTTAYDDNLVGADVNKPIRDESYSFLPLIGLDRRTSKQSELLRYSTGFNLYQNTSQLNGVSQNGSADYQFHISRYSSFTLSDTFFQNSNLYNQTNPYIAGGIPTGSGSSNSVLIAPFANQLQNFSSAGISYQYGKNAMVGGNGSYSLAHFSSVTQSQGLNDANSTGAGAFYSRRIGRSQYFGATYEFQKFITHPVDTYTQTNTIFGFYTHYFNRSLSFSILAGPEEYASWSPAIQKQTHWTPAMQGSFGWQSLRTNLVASFTRNVSGTPGFIGAYQADLLGLSARYEFARRWSVGATGDYALLDPVNTKSVASSPGGHTISGGGEIRHTITESLIAAAGYQHLRETYANIAAVSSFPDSNRAYFSLSYGFNRPLGR